MWPPQAADWPTRPRNYGWPDSATVDRVVSNGCDVVPVAHRQCREHDDSQWRMSFSRAEIVLINSWIPVQQIVYHILRFFIKTEPLTDSDNSGAGTLSNYHIKTLMLWACELKPRKWWTDDLNLVKRCTQLMHILGDWLSDAMCQHYFINNCNLIENKSNVTNIGGQLMSIDATWLSQWFVDNYILRCFELCPNSISRFLDDTSTIMNLHEVVSAIVAWRPNGSQLDLLTAYDSAIFAIARLGHVHPFNARLCPFWMIQVTKLDSRLCLYFTAVVFLHVAYLSSTDGINDELIDILATVSGGFIHQQHYSRNSASRLSLDQAAKMMKVVANEPLSTMSLIAIELSKAYLLRALRCKDSDSDCLQANVYLAVLYYTTGQYQTAIDHCTLVMRSQDHSQCSSHVVQGELLPKIDDEVDNMLGLAVFYQYIQASALNYQCPAQHVSVFTTELFAYYLHIKDLSPPSVIQISLADEYKRYETCISDTVQLFIGDVLLFISQSRTWQQKFYCDPMCRHSLRQPEMNLTEYSASYLVELLQKSAVEHLATFRQIAARDFGSIGTIVTTDFEAMYAYKCGDYQRCLQLSTHSVHTLLNAERIFDFLTFPKFIQLLDDDIASVIALTLIVNPKCRHICISQLTLSLYLMTQCQLKILHLVTSLPQTIDYVEVARRKLPPERILDQLTLKLTERKIVTYISALV